MSAGELDGGKLDASTRSRASRGRAWEGEPKQQPPALGLPGVVVLGGCCPEHPGGNGQRVPAHVGFPPDFNWWALNLLSLA